MRERRSAITSYLRISDFSTAPSPNQPPVGTPVKVTDLPEGDTVVILMMPSTTPSQCSARSPLWQT
ncbi:hypothetical protein D3C81_1378050 [compost metagenome]